MFVFVVFTFYVKYRSCQFINQIMFFNSKIIDMPATHYPMKEYFNEKIKLLFVIKITGLIKLTNGNSFIQNKYTQSKFYK